MTRPSLQPPRHPYLYLPDGWDATWQAAKQASASSPAWITFLTDSIGNGQGSSDWMNNSWIGKARAALLQNNALYGDYFSIGGYCPASITNIGTTFQGTAPWAQVLAPDGWYGSGAGVWCYDRFGGWSQHPAATCVTFTTPYACTAIDLLYYQFNAGTFQYNVDGGAWTTVTVTGTDNTGQTAQPISRLSLAGLSNAVHTLNLGNVSNGTGAGGLTNVLNPVGAACYSNPGAGIGFARMGQCGMQLQAYTNTSNMGDLFSLWTAKVPQAPATFPQGGSFGFPLQPHLFVLELGVNDCTNGAVTGQATGGNNMRDNLRALLTAVRRGRKGASILLLAPCYPDYLYGDTNYNTRSPYWQNYVDDLYALARWMNCALLNVHARWGETPFADGNIGSTSDIHPTDQGHADIGALLASVL